MAQQDGYRTNRRRLLKATGASAGAMSLAGCTLLGGSDDAFTVGGLWAASQGWGTWGQMMEQTVQYTIDQINDNGGIDGKDVEFVFRDTQIDPSVTSERATELIQAEDADVILGPNASSTRTAMSEVLAEEEVPGLYFVYYEGVEAPDYCNPWLFKFGGVPHGAITPIVSDMLDEYGNSVYLIGNDYVWPQTTNAIIREQVEAEGGEIVGEEYVGLGETNFSSIIPQIEQSNPDIVWPYLTGESALSFQQEAYNQGAREGWQEIHGGLSPLTLTNVEPEPFEGVLGTYTYFPTLDTPENQELVNGLQEAYGSDTILDIMTGTGHVTMRAVQHAVETSGGTSPEDIREGLREFSLDESPMGSVSMNPDHQLETSYYLGQVNGEAEYEILDKSEPISPPEQCNF